MHHWAQSTYLDETSFRALDFNRADFEELNKALSSVNWNAERDSTTFEDFPAEFTRKVLDVCLENVPRKRPPKGKPNVYNSLRRKKSRLKNRLAAALCAGDNARIKKLEDEIGLITFEIKEAIVKHLDEGERRAVEKIKVNPKYFYSYAKSFSKVKETITTLLNGEKKLVTEKKDLANILQTQFCSVFSDPACPDKTMPEFAMTPIISRDTDLTLTLDNIKDAISELKLDSAPGPDGIPSVLLKRCASSLAEPICLIWSESMSSGVVPSYLVLKSCWTALLALLRTAPRVTTICLCLGTSICHRSTGNHIRSRVEHQQTPTSPPSDYYSSCLLTYWVKWSRLRPEVTTYWI